MTGKQCIAIIPARGGSKRIPKKNIKDFLGRPVIQYPIAAALESKSFVEVMVSTDDEKIVDVAKKMGANVPFLRSEKNSGDSISLAQVVKEVLVNYRKEGKVFELACCILPTAVFVTPRIIKEGKQKILDDSKINSVISLTKFSYPIQRALKIDNDGVKDFFVEDNFRRSQDFEIAFHDAGQFYWFKIEEFFRKNCQRLLMYKADYIEFANNSVQDINTLEDWEDAEIKYRNLHK